MLVDLNPVSKWYVMHKNFRVIDSCNRCHSNEIIYLRCFKKGFKGIAPQCVGCEKLFSIQFKVSSKLSASHDKTPLNSDFSINN